jgi:hypothetical protein
MNKGIRLHWDVIVLCILGLASVTIILWPAARLPYLQLPFIALMFLHLRLEAKAMFGGGKQDPWAKSLGAIYRGFQAQPSTALMWTRTAVSLLSIVALALLTMAD